MGPIIKMVFMPPFSGILSVQSKVRVCTVIHFQYCHFRVIMQQLVAEGNT